MIKKVLLLALLVLSCSCTETNSDRSFDKKVTIIARKHHFKGSVEAHPERNNPFDIIYTDGTKIFQGCTGKNQGFCVFDTQEHGCRAGMIIVIHGYFAKGYDTVASFIKRYSATDQDRYISFICDALGCSPSTKLAHSLDIYSKMGHLITIFEGQAGKNGIATNTLRNIVVNDGLMSYFSREYKETTN